MALWKLPLGCTLQARTNTSLLLTTIKALSCIYLPSEGLWFLEPPLTVYIRYTTPTNPPTLSIYLTDAV